MNSVRQSLFNTTRARARAEATTLRLRRPAMLRFCAAFLLILGTCISTGAKEAGT